MGDFESEIEWGKGGNREKAGGSALDYVLLHAIIRKARP